MRFIFFFFFSSRRRHTRLQGDWSSDVCSSDLVPLAGIGTIAERPAHMAQNDGRGGEGPGQIDDVVELGMIYPGVQGEAERGESGQTRPKVRLLQHMRPCRRAAVADHRAGVPASRMAHTTEPSATGPEMRFEHRLDAVTQREIR